MTVQEAIRARFSVRQFANTPVSHEIVREILESAVLAPSSVNIQPWRFVVVRDPERKKRLREAAHDQAHVEQAPVVIAACADTRACDTLADVVENWIENLGDPAARISDLSAGLRTDPSLRRSVALRNTYIAVEHVALAATSLGLGSCWMEGFDPNRVREILRLPDKVVPAVLMPIGWTDQQAPPKDRFPAGKVSFAEEYGRPFDGC
ncbi:MAG: nitroreductase family protein [Nitrospirota bacterium]